MEREWASNAGQHQSVTVAPTTWPGIRQTVCADPEAHRSVSKISALHLGGTPCMTSTRSVSSRRAR